MKHLLCNGKHISQPLRKDSGSNPDECNYWVAFKSWLSISLQETYGQ